ncbi:MAG: hypothetical protein FWE31_04880 [Firmicutes bacterium]|nr:hypothetical protein [Bacillota bacterium]
MQNLVNERDWFFDRALNDKLKHLLDSGKLNEDERIVVTYHLKGLGDAMIRRIFGRSYQQFLFIEQDVHEKIQKLDQKATTGGAAPAQPRPQGPARLEFDTNSLSDNELIVLNARLETTPVSYKAISQLLRDKAGKPLTESKVKELELAALRKLKHPLYKLQRRVSRSPKA